MLKSLIPSVVIVASFAGCSSKDSGSALDLNVLAEKKVAAAEAMADAVAKPDAEFAVRAALEKYRKIPFQAKTTPEAAQKILKLYEDRMKGKIRGEAAADVAGEMDVLAAELK